MAFYDNVKDSVRQSETEENESSVSFDQLIANAKQAEQEREEEPDETEIEDFSGSSSGGRKQYGDPSSIELSENEPVQSSDTRSSQTEPVSEREKLRVKAKKKSKTGSNTSNEREKGIEEEKATESISGQRSNESDDLLSVLKEIRDKQAEMVSLLKQLMQQT